MVWTQTAKCRLSHYPVPAGRQKLLLGESKSRSAENFTDIFGQLKLLRQAIECDNVNDHIDCTFRETQMDCHGFLRYVFKSQTNQIIGNYDYAQKIPILDNKFILHPSRRIKSATPLVFTKVTLT